jgi:23S rRNA (cytidine1920-2'-O)/16S rRNA (cytidine1409-2'-O)-methyltransferase
MLLERTNIRHLQREALTPAPNLATIDVSFISLALVLPVVAGLLDLPREVIALVKPQFEVGKGQVGKGGVVRDPAKHRAVLLRIGDIARAAGFEPRGVMPSPLLGPKGNREFLIYLVQSSKFKGQRLEEAGQEGADWAGAVDACLTGAVPAAAAAAKRSRA